MLNKINLLRFLIVVLFLSTIAIATETTWRHSGFEISGYDISGASTYNLTEIRKIEFGWNTSIPAVSETSRAVMYYDDNQKRIMQSLNGEAYQAIVTNATVNAYTVNAANATGVLPNASIPLSAMNYSHTRIKVGSFTRDVSLASGTQSITGVGFKPVAIQFFANIGSTKQASWGLDDGTNRQSIITFDPTTADTWEQNSANSIYLMVTQDTTISSANVTTFDNDGFTLTWTKTGSPTGTAAIKYMAFR